MKTIIFAILIAASLAACGGGGGGGGPSAPAPYVYVGARDQRGNQQVLAFGDSTMHGSFGAGAPPVRVMEVESHLSIADRAVPGTRLEQLTAGTDGSNLPLQQELRMYPAARVVIENFGINETDTEVFRNALRQFVGDVRSAGMVPVIITPNPVFGPMGPNTRVMAQVARDVSQESGALLIDTYAQFAPLVSEADYVDGIHPNTSLYTRIATFEAKGLPQ